MSNHLGITAPNSAISFSVSSQGVAATNDVSAAAVLEDVQARICATAAAVTTDDTITAEKTCVGENANGNGTESSSTAAAANGKSNEENGNLLHFHEMPPHLQFNPYIFTGYRPLLNFWGCIHSLFYIHNETINILTHGVPIVYILGTVPGLVPWGTIDSWFLPWCHIVGAVAPWVGSFTYHTFMNLERGESMYYRLLQLDMLGIWISQSFGALPMVAASVYCLPWLSRWFILISYCLLSVWGLYKALTAWSPWERRLCFALPFIMRLMLCGLRYTGDGMGSPEAFPDIILQDVVAAIGGAIGAMHIPEKWYPGTVDMYLNSHNIMHVLVVMAVYFMHQATIKDLLWMANVECLAEMAPPILSTIHVDL